VTRFAWLQSRTQTLVAAAALGALAVAAAITGIQLSHLYDSLVVHCYPGCSLATSQFVSHQQFLQRGLDIVAQIAPALIGIFWGAPLLARELETGTYRLAWTQSVTRSRWLVTKIAVVGLATILLAGLLTLTITWWFRAIDHVSSNQYALFDRRDLAPIGYAAFAFAAGALIGAVIRRTVPAMATTLGVYIFARIATAAWIRPHLIAAAH
jgi:ABC-type transport system involved in multi-copper enzyme maturation permease subunit